MHHEDESLYHDISYHFNWAIDVFAGAVNVQTGHSQLYKEGNLNKNKHCVQVANMFTEKVLYPEINNQHCYW